MKRITLAIIIILFTNLNVKSQFEALDSITAYNYAFNNIANIHFSIMKRNNPREVINNYKAYLIISNTDTIGLYNDSIVSVKNLFYFNPPPIKLVVYYKSKRYEMVEVEKYITAPASNIWVIINTFCIGNKFVHHDSYSLVANKSKFNKPDIYTEKFLEYSLKGQKGVMPDSVIIKQNRKKNKYYIPNYF
jgi:hypothetical protein